MPKITTRTNPPGVQQLETIGILEPQRVGNLLVWLRERLRGGEDSTNLLIKNLVNGHVRVLARHAEYPITNGRKVVWNVPAGRPWQPLVRYDLATGMRATLSRRANDFQSLLPSPTITDRLLTWRTFIPTADQDAYSLVVRDLRSGQQYRLATGGDVGTPGLVFSGPGWGWNNRAVWEETVDSAAGAERSYLATTEVP